MDGVESKDFAGNWMCLQTLGEGAYGEVKLLMHRVSGETLAAKIVNLNKQRDAAECVRKEVCIHSLLDHENIIKLYGSRRELTEQIEYIYLEYAAGGELFNKIEPDVGMNFADVQKYMKQLLAGVEYLHKVGIAHRDIKPENLLLDGYGNLKISDFGMATVFRLKGKERLLEKRCGTMPYVAPEVLKKSYAAQPADVWSCGIVLIAMVAGELPWDEPVLSCQEFLLWSIGQYILVTPWSKLNTMLLSLARKILTIDPNSRPSITQILQHPWMQIRYSSTDSVVNGGDSVDGAAHLRQPSMDDSRNIYEPSAIAVSQPVTYYSERVTYQNLSELLKTPNYISFSQPTQNDDLIVSSQIQFSQTPLIQNNFQHLIQRMTRFFVTTSIEKTFELLGNLLDRLHYTWNTDASGVFTISTIDSRKMPLIFKATLLDMDGKLLVDFRLSKGCGLEFKRRFIKLRHYCSDIILRNRDT